MSIDELSKNHPIQENLEDILQGAKRAVALVKQILMFSSSADSRTPLKAVELGIRGFISKPILTEDLSCKVDLF